MRVAVCLLVLSLFAGCAPKFKGDIIDENRCDTIQGIMDYEEIPKNKHIHNKIFCDFEKSGEMFVEDMNNQTLKKIQIEEKEIKDIEAVFTNALNDICPECVAQSPEQADIVIKAKIIRFIGHIKKHEVSGDENAFLVGGNGRLQLNYQSALTVDTDISGKELYYDHIIDLEIDRKWNVEKMYAVVAANTAVRHTTEFVTKYDSMPLATGAVIIGQEMGSYFAVPIISNEMSGYIDIYDSSSLEVDRHLDLSTGDIDWWWTGKIEEDAKKEMIDLYSSGIGSLRYLVYDYIKTLFKGSQ